MQQDWPTQAKDAIAIQQRERQRVLLQDTGARMRLVAGVDCSFPTPETAQAVIVLMDLAQLTPLHVARAELPVRFPYVPGLLSFRELPVVLKALGQLPRLPDLLMVDGMGVAHPRRFGIASHLGVLVDLPAMGVGKSRLCGHYHALGEEKGATAALMDRGERIGTVLRSKRGCNPLFISAGHKISQERALALAVQCLTRYRLPEPTRLADKISKEKTPLQ